jgi:hypothetical protein
MAHKIIEQRKRTQATADVPAAGVRARSFFGTNLGLNERLPSAKSSRARTRTSSAYSAPTRRFSSSGVCTRTNTTAPALFA